MKKVIINSVMALSMLLLTALAVGLGIESVWTWVNHVVPAAWWCAPLGIVESSACLLWSVMPLYVGCVGKYIISEYDYPQL